MKMNPQGSTECCASSPPQAPHHHLFQSHRVPKHPRRCQWSHIKCKEVHENAWQSMESMKTLWISIRIVKDFWRLVRNQQTIRIMSSKCLGNENTSVKALENSGQSIRKLWQHLFHRIEDLWNLYGNQWKSFGFNEILTNPRKKQCSLCSISPIENLQDLTWVSPNFHANQHV